MRASWAWGVGLLFVLAGCQAGANVGVSCTRATECTGGLVCRFGRCRSECATNADCPPGSSCFLSSDGTGACSVDADHSCAGGAGVACPTGLTCLAERCVQTCTTSADCPRDGECQPVLGTSVSFCFDPRVVPDAGVPIDVGVDAAQADAGVDGGPGDAGVDGGSSDAGVDGGSSDAGPFMTPLPPPNDVCIGGGFLCAIVGSQVDCWGDSKRGALGPGPAVDCTTLNTNADQTIAGPVLTNTGTALTGVDEIACGAEFACAHTSTGEVWCWGSNAAGQLGTDSSGTPCSSIPLQIALGGPVSGRLVATSQQACFLENSGTLRCWGLDRGVIGTPGARPTAASPIVAPDAGAPLSAFALGPDFGCGATTSGDLSCWGNGASGQTSPGPRPRPGHVRMLSAGQYHGAAVQDSDGVISWGDDSYGELFEPPDGAIAPCADAAPCAASWVGPAADRMTAVVSQGDARFSCGIVAPDMHVDCWGENSARQSGAALDAGIDGFGNAVRTESDVLLTGVTRLYVGFENACARTASELYCWGANDRAQLQRTPGSASDASAAAIVITP